MAKVKYRLCMRRPEVGFDMHWHWGRWDEAVAFWWFERGRSDASMFYIQKSSGGFVEDMSIEGEALLAEAKRLMLRGASE